MTLDTFFEKFDEFAAAPNAVQKMRELILELAVRGKLVEQDEREGDAEGLFAKIETIAKNKGAKQVDGINSKIIPWFTIPSNWRWVRLGQIGEIIGGGTPKSSNGDYFSDEGISWLTPADLNGYTEKIIYRGRRCITQKGLENSSARVLPAGSVLFSSRAPIGYVVIAGAETATNQGFKSCVPFIMEMNEFIYYYLISAAPRIDREAPGTTFREVSGKLVSIVPFPLPPLAEQKRIVAKVDELMALCDRLEAQEAERKEKKRRLSRAAIARFAEKPTAAKLGLIFHRCFNVDPADFREAILELAVQGTLVPQGPNDGLALLEFKKIKERKNVLVRDRKIKKNEPGLHIDPCELDHNIPRSWTWVRLIDICELITDGTHQTPKYTDEGRVFLSAQNVKPFMFIPEKHRFVSEEHYQGYIKNRKPERGDILLTRVGAGIGEAATINKDLDFAIYVSLGLVRPVRKFVFSDYVTLWLNSPEGRENSSRYTFGKGVSQGNLNLSLIRNFLVPLPPLAEQKRIVAKVDELMTLVDKLEAQQAQTHELAERLMEAAVADVVESTQRQGARLVSPRSSVANEELREAFLISRIVSKTADPEHPLGRFRRTKFSYLAHRRASDDVTKHYIKKAAGPYSPWAKFDGPEDMARARGYVRDTKADPLEGMVAGERIGEVEEQVTDPLIGEAVDWVMKNFHFETNDSLELLTTVDFAAVGLRKDGKAIFREEVKNVIASSKDWTAKLKRELFSDENIDKALKRMAGVFPEMYGNA